MAELKPCPFCGAVTNNYGTAHEDDCYFTVYRRLLNDRDGDLSRLPSVIEAWNRRASIGDTPAPQSTEGGEGNSNA